MLWQGELGCGEGNRTEDGWAWQELKTSFRLRKGEERQVCVGNYDKRAGVCTPLVLCGKKGGNRLTPTNSLRHCGHRVSKSGGNEGRKSEHSCLALCQRALFLGTALYSWQESVEGPEEGSAEGGATEQEQCGKRGEGKWG